MADVTQTRLPGVGVRYEFDTDNGDRIGVVCHHGGRREVVVYDHADPDLAHPVVVLSADDARTVSELLGASRVAEVVGEVQQRIEGMSLEWIELDDDSPAVDHSIGDCELRKRTGASIVAVVRGEVHEPAPGPEFVFGAGDVAVAVGTPEALDRLRDEFRT